MKPMEALTRMEDYFIREGMEKKLPKVVMERDTTSWEMGLAQ